MADVPSVATLVVAVLRSTGAVLVTGVLGVAMMRSNFFVLVRRLDFAVPPIGPRKQDFLSNFLRSVRVRTNIKTGQGLFLKILARSPTVTDLTEVLILS